MTFHKKQSPMECFHKALAELPKSTLQISTHPPPQKGLQHLFSAAGLLPNSFHSSPHSCSSEQPGSLKMKHHPPVNAFLSKNPHHKLSPTAWPRGAALLIHFHPGFPLQKRHSSQVHMDVIDAFVEKVSCPLGYLHNKHEVY